MPLVPIPRLVNAPLPTSVLSCSIAGKACVARRIGLTARRISESRGRMI